MKLLRILLVLISATSAALAQTNAPGVRAMSLEDCIATALEHNFDIQIRRYQPEIARYTLFGTYGAYDPTLSLSGEHDYNLSPGGIDPQGRSFTGTETDVDRLSAGIQGFLPWGLSYNLGGFMSDQTGSRPDTMIDSNNVFFTTNIVYNFTNGSPVALLISTNFGRVPIRSPFETTSGDIGVLTLRQPLLKNFWIDSVRLTIVINKNEFKKSETDFRDQIMNTVTAVEEAYYNLIFSEENVKVQEKALELADRLLAENKRRVEVGALAPLDEKQAEAQAASSRADLLKAQADLGTQRRVLKDLLSDNYSNEWANAVLVPTDRLVALPRDYNLQESWRKGLAQGPRFQVQQKRLTVEQNRQRVRFQRNQVFPQLDLIGSYGFNASSREFSGALDQIRSGDNPFWSVGAQLTIPLGQTTARNNLKIAKATKEQADLLLKQGEQKTLIQIENDVANAQTDYQRVDATREARLYAEAALQAEQKKLESGKSTSFIVLELQKKLTDARSAEIRALADYNISLAELSFDEGSTFERRRITMEWK